MLDKNKLYRWVDNCVGIPLCLLALPLSRFRQKKPSRYDKILVIKFGTLGDAILLKPTLRTLRENFPLAHIAVLCSAANIEVFQNSPYLDEVMVIRFVSLVNPFYLLRLIRRIKKGQFNLTIDCEEWAKIPVLISFLAHAKERVGFKTRGQHKHYLFTKTVPHMQNKHELECFLDLLKPLGLKTENRDIKLSPQQANIREASRILADRKIDSNFVILHSEVPAGSRQRQWPIENLAELGKQLISRHKFKILIIATEKGRFQAERLNFLLGNQAELMISLPILTVYAILEKANFVVTNNTGFMHLAVSAGTRVFALHGPTSPLKWGPLNKESAVIKSELNCSPCLYLGFEYGCRTNRCMQQITPQKVLEVIERTIGCLSRAS